MVFKRTLLTCAVNTTPFFVVNACT